MRDDLADIVYPVLRAGLRLKQDLYRGAAPGNALSERELANRHAELRRRLLNQNAARQHLDFGGDGEDFRGGRYALTAWLDDLFILNVPTDSVCSRWWNQNQLEVALYNSIDAGSEFWRQADKAELLGRIDALEIFYLCVLLGFRGELRDQPDRVREWREGVERQLQQGLRQEWPDLPPSVPPESNVPPLIGRLRLRYALLWLSVTVAPLFVLVPLLFAYSYKFK
jgi:type VI secretion system protein ImpK